MPALRAPEIPATSNDRSLLSVVAMFGSVGVAATLLYLGTAALISTLLPVSSAISSVAAYVLAAMVSYYGHKHLSFTSKQAHAVEAPRFLISSAIGLLISYLVPTLAEWIDWTPLAAYVAVCVIVPAVNFVLLKSWVFRSGAGGTPLAIPYGLDRWGWMPALVFAAFIIQTTVWNTNGDTSWLLTVIDRMHAGDRLYEDIIELNPPSSIWLYMLPMHLSYLTGFPAEMLVNIYTLAICLVGVAMTGRIARAGNLMAAPAISPAMAFLLAGAVLLIGGSFSERDHIGTVLATPIIALAAWRADNGRPSFGYWAAAGCTGAMIAVVKPYYALIILAAATYVVVRRRDIRLFLLPEFLTAGALTAAYMATFYFAYPAYFEELLPLLRDTYMAFSWPLSSLTLPAVPWLAVPIVYWLLARRGGRTGLGDLFLICACVAWIPYFIQGKGWAYHTYPAVYLGSAAIIVAACSLIFGRPAPSIRPAGGLEIAGLALMAVLMAHLRFFADETPSRDFAATIRTGVSSPTIGILGGDIAAGHPLTRMVGARWIEPYCSDWIAIYALRLTRAAESRGETGRVAHYRQMAAEYLEAKRERLIKSPPDLLIVDEKDALPGIMIAEHGFATLMAGYERIASNGRLAIYRRTDAQPAS